MKKLNLAVIGQGRSGKDIHLFIAGYGVVGKALVDIISKNREKIEKRTGRRLHVCGLSNSRRFILNKNGLSLENIAEQLADGHSSADEAYFNKLATLTLENSVFVDCTASADIAFKYMNLFKRGYSVVACNKITFSLPYRQYAALKEAAIEIGATLRYETTVGAALPILESISRSVHSGDEIVRIEAVLSGTLNYIFSNYAGGEGGTFAEVVKRAQDAGYTEPDPRLDLSGRDVLRKLIILSREAGVPLDEKDVEISPILGPEFFEGKVPAFYQMLADNETMFAARYHEAADKGLRQRFVASLVKDETSPLGYKAKIGLEAVEAEMAEKGLTPEAIEVFQSAKLLYSPGKASNAGGVATSGLEMTQNSMRLRWTPEEVDQQLKRIMTDIHEACVKYGTEEDGYVNYVKGANIAGFIKVAEAMMAQGLV